MFKFTRQDFEDVYNTARMAHVGQKRRSGEEYFTHPSAVRNIVRRYYPKDRAAEIVALLHDTIEDAPGSTVETAEEMEDLIIGSIHDKRSAKEIVKAVKALTHEKGTDYASYVVGLVNNPLVLRVKLSDMVHNLSHNPSPKQKLKYANAIQEIETAARGKPAAVSDKHWDHLKKLTESSEISLIRMIAREII